MESCWHCVQLYLGFLFLTLCGGYPIDFDSADIPNVTVWTTLTPLLAVAFLVTSVFVLVGCVCCRRNKGFQEFTDSTSSHSLSGTGGYVNTGASATEFTIFPPAHAAAATSLSNRLSVPGDRSSIVQFEPLPEIRLPHPHGRRPAAFNSAVSHGLSSQDWFQDPHVNFPRQQLKYVREMGHGWFGRVVEGEAQNIVPEQKTSKVVVKILHEDATTTDQMYFLHEVKPYRELDHPNILKLLGRCLETDPFLVLLEPCPSGDLKSFLSQNIATAEALNQQGVTLQMCCNIASGLLHMHNNGFVHTDLAARNCLVTPDLSVKIGDYGTSIETFKEDYYCAGEVALPIRWCAPETLHCTDTTIETKEVTASANVWSLGVVLWEICEFGKLPYSDLNDDEVIVKVLGEGTVRLGLPSLSSPQRQNMYLLMKLCWSCLPERPPLLQVHLMLNHLHMNRTQYNQDGDSSSLTTDEDFERRWEMFKPNSIPKTDNHITSPEDTPVVQSPTQSTEGSSSGSHPVDDITPRLSEDSKALILPPAVFESVTASQDSGNLVIDGTSLTPLTTSPQPSLASSSGGEFFIPALQQRHKSPSLQNLHGSIDDLSECTVEITSVAVWQKEDGVDHATDVLEGKENEGSILSGEYIEDEVKETVALEPDFDSWLEGVETTNEEDAKFVRKISEAIRDLDNALALENTSSSSSSEASSKCVSHQSPAKDMTTEQNTVLDFRLGRADSGMSSDDKEMIFQLDSLQDDSFVDNAKSTQLENRATDSGTDTEDETWRRRIERGEFSEKVKQKSKSVADLMVLTHIECSDGSDSDPPSLTWSFERSYNGRGSLTSRVKPGLYSRNIPTAFSSESNIHGAVLGEEFKDTLKKLHEAQMECNRASKSGSVTDSLPLHLFDDATAMHSEICTAHCCYCNTSKNFLVIDASEEINKGNCVMEIITVNDKIPVNEAVLTCPSTAGPISHSDLIANTEVACDQVESIFGTSIENCVSNCRQVPEEDCLCSSVLASRCQDYKHSDIDGGVGNVLQATPSGAVPHKETTKSVNEYVPQKYVIESSLNSGPNGVSEVQTEVSSHLSMPHQNLLNCDTYNSSAICSFAANNTFKDSFEMNAGDKTEDDFFKGKYKESNSSPLFASTPHHPYHGITGVDSSHPAMSDASDLFQKISDTVSTFCPSKTLNDETSSSYSNSDQVSTLNTLSDSFHFFHDRQKIINDSEQSLEAVNPCDLVTTLSSHDTADLLPAVSTNIVPAFNLQENKTVGSVVIGPCEDYTLDYFKGLKTTYGSEPIENISTKPEDASLRLGNSSYIDEKLDVDDKEGTLLTDYSIDSWDRHLSTAFQEHEAKSDFFGGISFKSGPNSLTCEDEPVNHSHPNTVNGYLEQDLLSHETEEIRLDLLEDTRAIENCDQVHMCLKHNVDDANVTLDIAKDMSKLTTDKEVSHACHQRNLGSAEHDLSNVPGNVLNFLEDSQASESCDKKSANLMCEKVAISATISKAQERLECDTEVASGLLEDVSYSQSTELGGNEYIVDGFSCVHTPDDLPHIQEKLNTFGLRIPSLNFIAATPVPSGRNTPEILTEATFEVLCDKVETINPVVSNEQVISHITKIEEEDKLFTLTETFSDGRNEEENEVPLVSEPTSEYAARLGVEHLSGDVTLVSGVCINGCSSATETDLSTLIVTEPVERETNTENNGLSPEMELFCSVVLHYVESKDDTSELHETECEGQNRPYGNMPTGSPGPRETGSQNTEETVSSFGPSSHTQILKCGTRSLSSLYPQTFVSTNGHCEEGKKLTVPAENASQVNPQTEVPFQNEANEVSATEGQLISIHRQDKPVSSYVFTLESGKSTGNSTLNYTGYEDNIVSAKLKQNQATNIDAGLFEWSPEESGMYCEQKQVDMKQIVDPHSVKDIHKLLFWENSILEVPCVEEIDSDTASVAGHIARSDTEKHEEICNSDLMSCLGAKGITHVKLSDFSKDVLSLHEKNSESCSSETSNCEQMSVQPLEIKDPGFDRNVSKLCVEEITENRNTPGIGYEQVSVMPMETKNAQSANAAENVERRNENSKFLSYEEVSVEQIAGKQFKIQNPVQTVAENKEICNRDEVLDVFHTFPYDIFSHKEANRVAAAVDSWKLNHCDSNGHILMDNVLPEERLASPLTASGLNIKADESFDTAGEMEDDGEDFGLDVVKQSTPDDERSSDSGFRDKGSLSESCEEVCDEKYNLEDIEAELEDTFNKGGFNLVEKHHEEEEQNDRVVEDEQMKFSVRSSSDTAFNCIEKSKDEDQDERTLEGSETVLLVRRCDEPLGSIKDIDYFDSEHEKKSSEITEGKLVVFLDTLGSAEKGDGRGQLLRSIEEPDIEDKLKQESWESGNSDMMKTAHQFMKTACDVNSHDDASTGFHQHEVLTVIGDHRKALLPVKLQGLESSTMNSYMPVNQTNKLLESEREYQNAEWLNCESTLQRQQIVRDTNLLEHIPEEGTRNILTVTAHASDAHVLPVVDSSAGVNFTTEIHTTDRLFTECGNNDDETLSSILPDDKREPKMNDHCLVSTQNYGLNVCQTLSFDEAHMNEDMFTASSIPEFESGDLQPTGSLQKNTEFLPSVGWYLHPQPKSSKCEDIERGPGNLEEYTTSVNSGSSNSCEEGTIKENSYVSFNLDEEFVTAIRNELLDKLPYTRQESQEEELEEDAVMDLEDDFPQEERTDILIHYNMYPPSLSPILEERESVSSLTTTVSDNYSPLASSNQQDAPKSDSDSEPLSPVFVLDPKDAVSRALFEVNAKKFEQEIREALENCSLSSDDSSSTCDKFCKESSVLFEDLEQQASEAAQSLTLDGKNVVVVCGTNQHPDDDDLLVVNTETNEVTILESPKPKSHLAFVNNRETLQHSKSVDELSGSHNAFSDDEMILGVNSDTFVIDRSKFSNTFDVDSKLGAGKEVSSDDEAYTPDSISPARVTDTPSASTLQSPDTENLLDFFLTPSEKSPPVSCPDSPHGPQNSCVYNPHFLHSLSKNPHNPMFEEVQEICLGVANNEAAEIISELESSGVFNNNNNITNEKGIFTTVLPLCEKVSVQDPFSFMISSVNDKSEVLSVDDSSEFSEVTREVVSDDNGNLKRLSAVERLNCLTSPNRDIFSVKTRESLENSEAENSLNDDRRLLLNDTLGVLKRHKESQQSSSGLCQEDDREWSLPNLEVSVLSTKAPMPSPEEESWKQIPSMLAFSDVNDAIARCCNEQEIFGTANYVPCNGQTKEDDGDLMSTSFSIKGDHDDPECYTPDWESDSDDTNEDDNTSSSSGEFIWKEGDRESSVKAVDISATSSTSKPYEGLSDFPMEMIAEEEEDEDEDDDADGSSSSGSGTEFIPSAWNSEATPNRSALRSPDKKSEEDDVSDHKKNVSFKRQKYHSVYEYPRETSDSDSEGFDSPTHQHWNSLVLQSTQQPQVDYSSFADWELLDGDIVPDTDMDQDVPTENTAQQQLDFYKLSSVDYDFTNGIISEDGEFYISSSARPFQFPGGSNDVLTSGSQFFPGQLYHMDSKCKPADITVDFVTPDSGIIDVTLTDKLSALETGVDSYDDDIDTSPSSMSRFVVSFSDRQLSSHSSDRIKQGVWEDEVDCGKFGVDETSVSQGKVCMESVKLQELPCTDILELAKTADSTNAVMSTSVTSEVSFSAKPVSASVGADKDSEPVSQSPSSPLSPSGLGELRHTRDRLKLDLPVSSTAFVLDPPALGKRRSVETVKGEASLLDSGEETEDSGIESSNGVVTSLTREVKFPTEDTRKT